MAILTVTCNAVWGICYIYVEVPIPGNKSPVVLLSCTVFSIRCIQTAVSHARSVSSAAQTIRGCCRLCWTFHTNQSEWSTNCGLLHFELATYLSSCTTSFNRQHSAASLHICACVCARACACELFLVHARSGLVMSSHTRARTTLPSTTLACTPPHTPKRYFLPRSR